MYSNCDVDIYFYNFSTMVDNSKDLVYILNIIQKIFYVKISYYDFQINDYVGYFSNIPNIYYRNYALFYYLHDLY